MAFFKNNLVWIAALVGIGAFFAGIGAYVYTTNKRSEMAIEAVRDSAYSQGKNEAIIDAQAFALEHMTIEVRRLADIQERTNDRLADIRSQTRHTERIIHDYPAEQISITRPEEVEAWANQTTNDLFNDISEITK